MTSASVLFCGRRSSRSTHRIFDEHYLGFRSVDRFPSLSHNLGDRNCSCSCSSCCCNRGSHNRRHCKSNSSSNQRRQSRRQSDDSDEFRRSSHVSRPSSSRASATGGCVSVHLDRSVTESPSGSIVDQEALVSINSRYGGNSRLPRAVLLARERLLQRLRGAPVSEARQIREAPAGAHHNVFWLIDAGDWETSILTQHLPGSSSSTESPSGVHQLYSLQEPGKKPPGLTKDMVSSLHHEIFSDAERSNDHATLEATNDCSICLESFVEGNTLIRLPCWHRFHTSCLYPWVETCGECPYCRTAIILIDQAEE
ncbi:hypothetical protein Ancab_017643 [Ancistrocladus abbreviatus]